MKKIERLTKRSAKIHKEYMKNSARSQKLHVDFEAVQNQVRAEIRKFLLKNVIPSGVWTRIGRARLRQAVPSIPQEVMTYLKSLTLDHKPASYAEVMFSFEIDDEPKDAAISVRKCDDGDGYHYTLHFSSYGDDLPSIKALKIQVDSSVELAQLRDEEATLKSSASVTRSRLKEIRAEIAELEASGGK